MARVQKRLILSTVWLAVSVITLQLIWLFIQGETFCLNSGCGIVEDVAGASPVWINLAGLAYFLLLWAAVHRRFKAPAMKFDGVQLLLAAGLAVEGVLLGFQLQVARALCLYCLLIFTLILLLNLIYGLRQTLLGGAMFLSVAAAFMTLDIATLPPSENRNLESGSLAVKHCAAPSKKLYFFFSSSCEHCQSVLKTLESCNSCEFYLNPVDTIRSLQIPDLEYKPTYDPDTNRLLLSLLGIDTIPVVIVENPVGLNFIRGEKSIIRYLKQACFQDKPLLYMNSSQYTDSQGISVYDEQDECNLRLDCPEPADEVHSTP